MIRSALSIYFPKYPSVLVYMLQSTEYQIKPYLQWIWRTSDFSQVAKRRALDRTKAAKLLLTAVYVGILVQIALGILLILLGAHDTLAGGVVFGIALILVYPVLWAHLLVVPLVLGRYFISGPAEQRMIADATPIFANHPGVKVAVVGSYGKTSMKELLNTVLSEGLNVAATPANKNVSSSHARFAKRLTGDEDVLVIEYGEGAPGDVARFAKRTSPTHAIITGVAPAHLDQYKTLEAAGQDIFSIAEYVDASKLYVNSDSPDAKPFIKEDFQQFSNHSVLGWNVSDVQVTLDGTSFTIKKAKKIVELRSGLVGEHQVGFLAFVAALAFELGLTEAQAQAGMLKTKPFEHRMQPYVLGGANVVDDTYNGNLEGIRAGTNLLKTLEAKRKIYVTPGLVDQGEQTEHIHNQVGELIAKANPDVVVLMQNSVTGYIQAGLKAGKFSGEVRVETEPLEYYLNLKHHVAKGDLVVMQNDWTDNYA